MQKPEKHRVLFFLPVSLHHALKIYSAKEQVSMSRLVESCLLRDRQVGPGIRSEMEHGA